MAGNNSIRGDETVTFTDNMSFDGTERDGKMTTNGQLWIGSTVLPHVKLGSLTSPNGTVSIGYASPNITVDVSTPGIIVTTFTANGTWTINLRTVMTDVYAWGGGSGGGGGCVDISANQPGGGNGGGQGSFIYQRFFRSAFTSPVSITVGIGGLGGAGAAITGGNGVNASPGTNTIIPLTIGSLTAFGSPAASGGSPGSVLDITTISTDNSFTISILRTSGTVFSPFDLQNSAGINNNGLLDVFGIGIGSGGGTGGPISGSFFPGINGGNILIGAKGRSLSSFFNQIILSGGLGGTIDGSSGSIGSNASTIPWNCGGTGGGGGASSILTNGGNGANAGLRGAGGGGGGAALTGVGAGGNGGNGSRGEVIIIEYL